MIVGRVLSRPCQRRTVHPISRFQSVVVFAPKEAVGSAVMFNLDMKLLSILLIAFAVLLPAPVVRAADFPERLKSFISSHLKFLEAQDTDQVIANLHPKEKNREKSIQDMRTQPS